MSDANTELLMRMAKALGELRERLVFVGGCATALLITDPAAAPARAWNTGDWGKEQKPKAVKLQLRPDPLAR